MAHFQVIDDQWLLKNKPWLFPKGARLFVEGDAGVEKIHIHTGQTIRLELAGSSPKTVRVRSTEDKKITVSALDGQQRFTVKAESAGTSILEGLDATGSLTTSRLIVVGGDVVKHPDMEVDLIADILQGSDAARIHALHRFLNDNHDNIFNENWQAIIDKRGERACGTVAKDGGQALWGVEADAHSWQTYHIPFPVPKPNPGQPLRATVTDRKAVKFKEAPVLRGALAIAGWLQKKRKPVVIGVLYGPSTARPMLFTNRYGQIERTGLSGHTVLVVGCDKAKENFLYIDPWHGGSRSTYQGGIRSDPFTKSCSLGILSLNRSDLVRGPILRQTTLTEGSFSTAEGTFLEAISGP